MNAMQKLLIALALCVGAGTQAADVGVSLGFSQPGVYGRVDIGRFPAPVLVQSYPVYVERTYADVEPVYLWAPYEHRRHWRRHCGYYGACGRPVYFVEDHWYRNNVMVEYRDRGRGHGHGHHHHRHHGRD